MGLGLDKLSWPPSQPGFSELKAFASLQKTPVTMETPGITMDWLSGKLFRVPPGALIQSGRMGDIQQSPDLATMPC